MDSDSLTQALRADESSSKLLEATASCPQTITDLSEALLPMLAEQFAGRNWRLLGDSSEDCEHCEWSSTAERLITNGLSWLSLRGLLTRQGVFITELNTGFSPTKFLKQSACYAVYLHQHVHGSKTVVTTSM